MRHELYGDRAAGFRSTDERMCGSGRMRHPGSQHAYWKAAAKVDPFRLIGEKLRCRNNGNTDKVG